MANHVHIEAPDGSIIQVNAKELETEAGREWLKEEMDSRRKDTHDKAEAIKPLN